MTPLLHIALTIIVLAAIIGLTFWWVDPNRNRQ